MAYIDYHNRAYKSGINESNTPQHLVKYLES